MAELGRALLRDRVDDGTYPEGFWNWIEDNWHVYRGFVSVARRAKMRGFKTWSADAVCHVLRFETPITERGELKINNNATAGLARLAMALEPDLKGFFRTRRPPGRDEALRLDGTSYQ